MTFTTMLGAGVRAALFAGAGLAALTFGSAARADDAHSNVQVAQAPAAQSWMDPKLLAAAKKEGALTVYGSMNEGEALPLLKLFENATGIKSEYVRNSDTGLMARIMVEVRAN